MVGLPSNIWSVGALHQHGLPLYCTVTLNITILVHRRLGKRSRQESPEKKQTNLNNCDWSEAVPARPSGTITREEALGCEGVVVESGVFLHSEAAVSRYARPV